MALSAECVVIGAGVIGLSIARALSLKGMEVLLLESSNRIGSGISSRNSEVIHAGLYYKTALKRDHCIRGKKMIYSYLNENKLPFSQCGKLVVASNKEQVPLLHTLAKRATDNGVEIELLSPQMVRKLEPNVECAEAFFSPTTGILDSYSFMQQLHTDAESNGALTSYNTHFLSGKTNGEKIISKVVNEGKRYEICSSHLINCAGLCAGGIARSVAGFSDSFYEEIPATYFAKGSYFRYVGHGLPFRRLVYPLPEPGGLGIHATVDLQPSIKFGPNVEWLSFSDVDRDCSNIYSENELFSVQEKDRDVFWGAVRKYLHPLQPEWLQGDYSGIRPKLHPPSVTEEKDFLIIDHADPQHSPSQFSLSSSSLSSSSSSPSFDSSFSSSSSSSSSSCKKGRMISLIGIESPGLTSSLSIGESVSSYLLSFL